MKETKENNLQFVVYYESIKREPKIRGIKKCRCDERLQTKTKEFTRLPYTGLVLELIQSRNVKGGLIRRKKINVFVKECFGAVLPEPVEGMRDRWAG